MGGMYQPFGQKTEKPAAFILFYTKYLGLDQNSF